MEVSGQLHALATLLPEKDPPVPIGSKTGWASEPVWTLWCGENSCPYREWNPGRPARSPFLISATMSLLFEAGADRAVDLFINK
jgi:hypothetical protein